MALEELSSLVYMFITYYPCITYWDGLFCPPLLLNFHNCFSNSTLSLYLNSKYIAEIYFGTFLYSEHFFILYFFLFIYESLFCHSITYTIITKINLHINTNKRYTHAYKLKIKLCCLCRKPEEDPWSYHQAPFWR